MTITTTELRERLGWCTDFGTADEHVALWSAAIGELREKLGENIPTTLDDIIDANDRELGEQAQARALEYWRLVHEIAQRVAALCASSTCEARQEAYNAAHALVVTITGVQALAANVGELMAGIETAG